MYHFYTVTGVCYDVLAGSHRIDFKNGECIGETTMGGPHTNSDATLYMIAEEIVLQVGQLCTAQSPSECSSSMDSAGSTDTDTGTSNGK